MSQNKKKYQPINIFMYIKIKFLFIMLSILSKFFKSLKTPSCLHTQKKVQLKQPEFRLGHI